jgi:hypothetical protein
LTGFLRFGLENNSRLTPFRIGKAFGSPDIAVLGLQFIQGTSVKCPGGTGLNTYGQLLSNPPIQAKIALAHLRTRLRSKLGGVIGTGLKAFDVALLIAEASLAIHDDDPVFLPF